jgi:hypothetical protein
MQRHPADLETHSREPHGHTPQTSHSMPPTHPTGGRYTRAILTTQGERSNEIRSRARAPGFVSNSKHSDGLRSRRVRNFVQALDKILTPAMTAPNAGALSKTQIARPRRPVRLSIRGFLPHPGRHLVARRDKTLAAGVRAQEIFETKRVAQIDLNAVANSCGRVRRDCAHCE